MSKHAILLFLSFLITISVNAQSQHIVDADSVLSLEMPEDWIFVDLGLPEASVQMASATEDAFLMLIVESKEDMFGWNMARFVYVTVGQSMAALNFPEISPIEYGTTDGAPSAHMTVAGATSGQQFHYYRVSIEAPEHWVQVILGSKRSSWEEYKPIFDTIRDSIDVF